MIDKCVHCGGDMKLINLKGREFNWKGLSGVVLAYDFGVLGCSKCGDFLLRSTQGSDLDRLLEKSINVKQKKSSLKGDTLENVCDDLYDDVMKVIDRLMEFHPEKGTPAGTLLVNLAIAAATYESERFVLEEE